MTQPTLTTLPTDLRRRRTLAALSAGLLAPWLPLASSHAATNFPTRAITLVVPFGPGGVADVTARTVAKSMAETLGQAIVIENRPGAGGIVATSGVVRARPDGHTMLLISNATAISSTLFPKQNFDVQKDLQPVSTMGHFDLALCVGADSPYQTLQAWLDAARAEPGKLTIGTIAVGSTQNLAAELFKSRAGIDALIVPYNGSAEVLTALRAGEIDMAIDILSPLLPQLEAGAARALAVTATERHPQLPNVPTAAEGGVDDFAVSSWNALAVPAATPAPVVARLQEAMAQALNDPAVQEPLARLGVRAESSTPEAAKALLDSETVRWRDVIQAAGIARS